MLCRFCSDSGSYATNEIGRWGRLFDVSDPISWPRFIGAFSCQFPDVDRNESAATRRRVDPVSSDQSVTGSTRDAGLPFGLLFEQRPQLRLDSAGAYLGAGPRLGVPEK